MSDQYYSTYEIRVRAVDAVLRGQSRGEVARAFGINRGTLYRWMQRFDGEGDEGLQRRVGSGRPRKLAELDREQLWDIVLQPATTFGYEADLWTVGRLHEVITNRYRVAVSRDTIWRRLREAGSEQERARIRSEYQRKLQEQDKQKGKAPTDMPSGQQGHGGHGGGGPKR